MSDLVLEMAPHDGGPEYDLDLTRKAPDTCMGWARVPRWSKSLVENDVRMRATAKRTAATNCTALGGMITRGDQIGLRNRKPQGSFPEACSSAFLELVYQLQNRPAATL
jgi:hypothetical protein